MVDPSPCPPCPRKYLPLPGDGPQPCRYLCIAERPGYNENKQGRVLVGKAGQEQDETYFPLAGLRRSQVRCTNAVRCWADSNRTPSDKEIAACAAHHLPGELAETQPEVVFLLGASACSLCPGINLDTHHGIPRFGRIFGWEGIVVPMYHPAIGLHEGRWMTPLLEDWSRVMEELALLQFEEPEVQINYRVLHVGAVTQYLQSRHWPHPPGVDTESHGASPYSVQFSHWPGEGWFIRADDHEAVEWFAQWAVSREVALHFAGHDLEVLRRLGIRVPHYRDTMQEAFHLGNLPQGLKPLVYRLFRVTMHSWEDTVRPASINALLTWLGEAMLIARADLYSTKTKTYKTCICGHSERAHSTFKHLESCPCRVYTPREEAVEVPGDAERLFHRLIGHTDESSEYDPWERLDEFWRENGHAAAHIEARVGRYPILGIGNCTEAQAIRYAVGDADWTGQVAVELERRRREGGCKIAAGDEDA